MLLGSTRCTIERRSTLSVVVRVSVWPPRVIVQATTRVRRLTVPASSIVTLIVPETWSPACALRAASRPSACPPS